MLADTGGTAFWTSGTTCPGGSGVVGGAIEAQYRALGGCGSILGVPRSNELATPDGIGRYTVFERGSIYWTKATGAHEVLGVIRDTYKSLGWEAGALGYPVSGEYDVAGGRRSDFQHGSLTWASATDEATVTHGAHRRQHRDGRGTRGDRATLPPVAAQEARPPRGFERGSGLGAAPRPLVHTLYTIARRHVLGASVTLRSAGPT